MKLTLRIIYGVFSIGLLLYLLWPYQAGEIEAFSALPGSVRSKLSGDTVEVQNVKAYFSNEYRKEVIDQYLKEYKQAIKFPFAPLMISYPPEDAFTWIKDQTHSTYLVEITYPLRDSLFVNGLEPFDETTKELRYRAGTYFEQDGELYETKVTLRYYPSNVVFRLIVWFGIVALTYLSYRLAVIILKR